MFGTQNVEVSFREWQPENFSSSADLYLFLMHGIVEHVFSHMLVFRIALGHPKLLRMFFSNGNFHDRGQ